jgi:hypothetical protein
MLVRREHGEKQHMSKDGCIHKTYHKDSPLSNVQLISKCERRGEREQPRCIYGGLTQEVVLRRGSKSSRKVNHLFLAWLRNRRFLGLV